jgi:hypothetical protein
MAIKRNPFATAYLRFDHLMQKMTMTGLSNREYQELFHVERRMQQALARH